MNKVQLLLSPVGTIDRTAFAARVRSDVAACIGSRGVRGTIAIAMTSPRLSYLPLSRAPFALVSLWGVDDLPRFDGVRVAAYRVEESVPLATTSSVVSLITTFRRKRGLDDSTFLARWHDGHTPLALGVHPFTGYVRNRVIETLDGPPLDAIVEEHFASRADVLDPRRMFGGMRRMIPNMIRIGADIAGFIDLGSMTNHLVEEIESFTEP